MADTDEGHRKVWFGRKDRQNLNRLPSAEAHPRFRLHGARLARGLFRSAVYLVAIVAVLAIGLVGWLWTYGISSPYFARSAESLIRSIAGPGNETRLSDARLSIDRAGNLAFEADNLSIGGGNTKVSGSVGQLKVGVKALPLLAGRLETAQVEAANVLIDLPAGGQGILSGLKLPDGRIDPGLIPALFSGLANTGRSQFLARGLNQVTVDRLTVRKAGSQQDTVFADVVVSKAEGEAVQARARVNLAGQNLDLAGNVAGDGAYHLEVAGISLGAMTAASTPDPEQAQKRLAGSLTVNGVRRGGLQVATATLSMGEIGYLMRSGARFFGSGLMRVEATENVGKLEILPSYMNFGANSFNITGAIGLPAETASADGYRFELLSNDSRLQPSDSPDDAINVGIRVVGTVVNDLTAIRFTDMNLRTTRGDVIAQGAMRFASGTPEMYFGIRIPELPVAFAKQLWPNFAAMTARRWVLDHVYGGEIFDSRLDLAFPAGYFSPLPKGVLRPKVKPEEVSGDFNIRNARFDVIGDLPPVRDAMGRVEVRGADTSIALSAGTAFLENGTTADVTQGTMLIPTNPGRPTIADLDIHVSGQAAAIANLASREPINALKTVPFTAADVSGTAKAQIKLTFPLRKADGAEGRKWAASVDFDNLSIAKDFSGQKLTDASGTLDVNQLRALLKADGRLNGVPAQISLTEPIGDKSVKRDLSAVMQLDDKARETIAPGLGLLVKGKIGVEVKRAADGSQAVTADLSNASLFVPWTGWTKGPGVGAKASFTVRKTESGTSIRDFALKGSTFKFAGGFELAGGSLQKATLSDVALVRGDDASVTITRSKGRYDVTIDARQLDLRGIIKKVVSNFDSAAEAGGAVSVRLNASIANAIGFGGETLQNLQANYSGKGADISGFTASGMTVNGGAVSIANSQDGGQKTVQIEAADAGGILRFLDYYDKMRGGQINVRLASSGKGPLIGDIDARNFTVVGEPRLRSLVGSPAANDPAVANKLKSQIDVSRVKFERGYSKIEKGTGYLKLAEGILRSEQIGLSYSGLLYDKNGRIDINGTFLPAYGLNRIFGEIPIVGQILGNGRDKGLIGITFNLSGAAKSPQLSVNPISLVAPGIFRQIFEFR